VAGQVAEEAAVAEDLVVLAEVALVEVEAVEAGKQEDLSTQDINKNLKGALQLQSAF
jgi:hypothetical protein